MKVLEGILTTHQDKPMVSEIVGACSIGQPGSWNNELYVVVVELI